MYIDTSAKKLICELKTGEEIYVISTKGEWSRIAWENFAGWIKTQSYQTKPERLNSAPIATQIGKNSDNEKIKGSYSDVKNTIKCSLCSDEFPTLLQSHEPNFLGYTYDDNDVPYVDFKVSLKYPLFGRVDNTPESYLKRFRPTVYLAFTGRFGQYVSKRDSNPVVGKRFNPELIARFWLGSKNKYLDFTFGHESNGQSINSEREFSNAQKGLEDEKQDPEFARDSISRGWDYVGLNWQNKSIRDEYEYGYGLKLRYFFVDGPFQGEAENSNPWENDGEHFRQQYDGITISSHFAITKSWIIRLPSLSLSYTTGYEDTFQNNTFRLDSTILFGKKDLPIVFWASRGFNSDLVDYYKRTTSFGLALKLKTYLGQGI